MLSTVIKVSFHGAYKVHESKVGNDMSQDDIQRSFHFKIMSSSDEVLIALRTLAI